jgi:lipoprotein-anchoring transpeptidase ErfK/SrfK
MKSKPVLTAVILAAAVIVLPMAAHGAKKSTKSKSETDSVLTLQIVLDQAGFSTGEIDGHMGTNIEKILSTFQEANGLTATGKMDEQTSAALMQATGGKPPLTTYEISEEDAAGPFIPNIPSGMMEKAKLPMLGYRDIKEKLGEKFHVSPELLQQLNGNASYAAGEQIVVPNVEPFEIASIKRGGVEEQETEKNGAGTGDDSATSGSSEKPKDSTLKEEGETSDSRKGSGKKSSVTINVSKSRGVLTLTDESDRAIYAAPVTTGSEHDPLPIGEWKVDGIEHYPPYQYDPKLFWDAKPGDQKAKLKGGPNSPVGIIWIATTKRHYGIHGTPEPGKIGHAESHGCVRLPNWSVAHVAGMVQPGTKIVFTE